MKLFNGCKSNQYDAIIVTDFKKLDPNDFYNVHGVIKNIRKELILCTYDGRLFVNKKNECADLIYGLFDILMHESMDTLHGYEKRYKRLFPNIKSFDDWMTTEDTDINRTHTLAMLCVPIEIKRRELVLKYYNGSTQNQ